MLDPLRVNGRRGDGRTASADPLELYLVIGGRPPTRPLTERYVAFFGRRSNGRESC